MNKGKDGANSQIKNETRINCQIPVQKNLLLLLKITPFPGLDEFIPGKGIKDILGSHLAGIIEFIGALAKVLTGGFPAI